MDRIVFRAAALLAVVALSLSAQGAARAQAPEPLAMSYVPANSAYWDIAVAWEKGFFAREGFAPSYATNTGSVQSTQLLITNAVQMAITQPELLLAALSRGTKEIGAIAAPMERPDWLLVAQDSIKGIEDLKGKVVGFSGMRVGEYWLAREVFKEHGLGPKDVDAIQIGTSPAKFAALQKGSIAATVLFQPTAAQAVESGFKKLYDFSDRQGFTPLVYMVNRAWAGQDKHGERLARALRDAHAWLFDPANRAEALAILAKATKRDVKILGPIYEQYFAANAYSRDGAVPLKSIASLIALMVENGELDARTAPKPEDIVLPAELGGMAR